MHLTPPDLQVNSSKLQKVPFGIFGGPKWWKYWNKHTLKKSTAKLQYSVSYKEMSPLSNQQGKLSNTYRSQNFQLHSMNYDGI